MTCPPPICHFNNDIIVPGEPPRTRGRPGNLAATDSPDRAAMRRRLLIAGACAFVLAAPARAAEAEGKGDVGQYVDLQPVGLPIVDRGRLVNYVFVSVRINLTSAANASRLREKEPFFRDALVRAAHRTPFTLASDFGKIDAQRLASTLKAEAARIAGQGQIRSVVVTQQAPLRRYIAPRG
jgi:flagellar basal body-associated protein FliL